MVEVKYVLTVDNEHGNNSGVSLVYDSIEAAMSVLGGALTLLPGIRAATKMESRQNAIGVYDIFYDKNGIKSGKALWYEDPVDADNIMLLKYYDMINHYEYHYSVRKIYTQEKSCKYA